MIVENYRENGVDVEEFFASGGISQKNQMMMQIYSDVLNMPIKLAGSEPVSYTHLDVYKRQGFFPCSLRPFLILTMSSGSRYILSLLYGVMINEPSDSLRENVPCVEVKSC